MENNKSKKTFKQVKPEFDKANNQMKKETYESLAKENPFASFAEEKIEVKMVDKIVEPIKEPIAEVPPKVQPLLIKPTIDKSKHVNSDHQVKTYQSLTLRTVKAEPQWQDIIDFIMITGSIYGFVQFSWVLLNYTFSFCSKVLSLIF